MRSLLPLGVLALALAACSGDDTTMPVDSGTDTGGNKDASVNDSGSNDAGKDTGTTDSSATDSSTVDASDAAVDSGPQPVNGCVTFVDKSATNDVRTIDFPQGSIPAQYSPNCMKVKAGQTVTWNGAFASHPLVASGGDSGSPITTTSTGTTKAFTFPTQGTYGFACMFHGGSMFGAIEVVP